MSTSCLAAWLMLILLTSLHSLHQHPVSCNVAENAAKTVEDKASDAGEAGQSWTDWAYETAHSYVKGSSESMETYQQGPSLTESLSTLKDTVSSYVPGKKEKGSEAAKEKVGEAYDATKEGVEGESRDDSKQQSGSAADYASKAASDLGEKTKESVEAGSGREEL